MKIISWKYMYFANEVLSFLHSVIIFSGIWKYELKDTNTNFQ